MDVEKIIERLFLVVAKKKRHTHYNRTVELLTEYMALVAGVGLDKKLKKFVRRESDELFNQRVELTNHIVTGVSKNLFDPFYKVPRSNSGRRVLTFEGDDKGKKVKEVEDILKKFWGDESWDDYMGTRFPELNSVDPNSFVVFEWKDFDNEKEFIQPYPYEVSSTMAVDYKKINKVLEYLIAKDEHIYQVNPTQPKITPANGGSILPDTEKDFKKGSKYTLYAKNQTFQLIQVSEKLLTGLSGLTEGKRTKLGNGEYVKLGDGYYEFKTFTEHNCGRVPAVQVGYLRDLTTGGRTFVSPIHPAVPYLNKTIKVNSELDLVATLLAFPQPVMYSEPCDADGCYEGTVTAGDSSSTCKVCNGTGKKATAPSSQDAIILNLPESKEQLLPIDQLIKYIAPPVDIVKWQEEYIEKITFNAKRIMFNSDVFDRKQIADTATGKTIDMQNVYDTLHGFAIKFGKTWKAGVEITAKLADRAEKLVASYTFGKDFKLKTLDSLILDLSVANGIGSPALVQHLNNDIAQIIFAEKPLEYQRYQLKELHNPFSGKGEKEIAILLASGLVSRRDKVVYANFPRIFDELEIEYVKNKKNFYELGRLDQREEIYRKADEIITELEETNPAPELD